MSFFEPFGQDSEPEPEQRVNDDFQDRFASPRSEVGVMVPARLLLYRDSETAISLTGLTAYSTGFELSLNTFRRIDDMLRLHHHVHHAGAARKPLDDRLLRFGVEYADGRRGANLERFRSSPSENIRVWSGGSGGGGNSYRASYRVSPLPPAGPVSFVLQWPIVAIPETRRNLDASVILDAAANSRRLWA